MTVPPLFDHLDNEDEDQLRRDSTSRDAGFETGGGQGVDDDARPTGPIPDCGRGCTSSRSIGRCAWSTCASPQEPSSPSTSTGSLKAGGTPGVRSQASLPRPPPPRPHPHQQCRARPRCRAATRSAQTESSYAPPNTPQTPTPSLSCLRKPRKTPNEGQKQPQSTSTRSWGTHGTPETYTQSKIFPIRPHNSFLHTCRTSLICMRVVGRTEANPRSFTSSKLNPLLLMALIFHRTR